MKLTKHLILPLLGLAATIPCVAQDFHVMNLTLTPYVSAGGQQPLWIDTKGGLWGVVAGKGAAAMGTLYYAAGNAQTWSAVYSFPNASGQTTVIKNVWISPVTNTIFAGLWTGTNYEIERSTNGTSWTNVMTFPTSYGVTGRDNLTFDDTGNVFVVMTHCAAGITGSDSIWRSTNDGVSFNSVLTEETPTQVESFRQIYVNPYVPTDIYALAGGVNNALAQILVSHDDGTTWSAMMSGANANAVSLGFYPALVIWATEGPPATRKFIYYCPSETKIISIIPVENEIIWMNQVSYGIVALGRQSLVGVPANVYTLAVEPDGANYHWMTSLTWKGAPSNTFRWGFGTTNVGPGNEFFLLGDGLDDSSIDTSECMRAVPYVGMSSAAWVAQMPTLRPRFIPGN